MEFLYILAMAILALVGYFIILFLKVLLEPVGMHDFGHQTNFIMWGEEDLQKHKAQEREADQRWKATRKTERRKIDECAATLEKSRAMLFEQFGEDSCVNKANHEISKYEFDKAWQRVLDLAEAKYGFYIVYDARAKLQLI